MGSRMIITLELPGYIPTPLNKLMGNWRKQLAKRRDREVIGTAARFYAGTPATDPQTVDITIIWPKGRRSHDPDANWKAVCDALVQCGLLRNDNNAWCRLGKIHYAKSADDYACTIITLTEGFHGGRLPQEARTTDAVAKAR
jgi:hypothetical protein